MDMEWIYASVEKEPLREYFNQITAELANALLALSMGWGREGCSQSVQREVNGSGMAEAKWWRGEGGVSLGRRGEIKTKF